jgi:GntR family transcriptional regulator
MSKTLGIPLAESISELTLLGLGNDEPMSFYTSYHSLEVGKQVFDIVQQFIKEELPFTTLDIFKKLREIKLGNIYQTFEASVSDAYISNILHIKKGSPILIVESILYTSDDQPLEHRTAVYRGDKYKFSIVRRLSNE